MSTAPVATPGAAPDGRLAGKVALVTGSTRGIGAAIARRFAAEGARVVACGRSTDEGTALEAEIRAAGGDAAFVTSDVSDESVVAGLVAMIRDRYGRLDILVNNAGTTASGPLEATDLATWRAVVDGNLTSMFLVSKHAIPLLRAGGGGSIINLGSTYGLVGVAGSSLYAMTKAGAISLARTLALELATDHIRVNALCPGATATPMNLEWLAAQPDPAAALAALTARHPIGRLSEPEEQAAAAVFLASDEASYVTGHAMLVDGGYTAI